MLVYELLKSCSLKCIKLWTNIHIRKYEICIQWNFLPYMILVEGQLVEPWILMFVGIFKVLIGVRIQWLDRKTIHKYGCMCWLSCDFCHLLWTRNVSFIPSTYITFSLSSLHWDLYDSPRDLIIYRHSLFLHDIMRRHCSSFNLIYNACRW